MFNNAKSILTASGADKCSVSFDVRPIVYLYKPNIPFWHQDEGKDAFRIIDYFYPSSTDQRLIELGGTYFIDPEKISFDDFTRLKELTTLKSYKQSAEKVNEIIETNQKAVLKPSASLLCSFPFDGTIHSAPFVESELYNELSVDMLNKILITRYDINLPRRDILSAASF